MDSDTGGLSPTERQRQTAAEIARKKVLAVYSSTVQNLKNLPASSRERLIHSQGNQRHQQSATTAQPAIQPNWMQSPNQASQAAQTNPVSQTDPVNQAYSADQVYQTTPDYQSTQNYQPNQSYQPTQNSQSTQSYQPTQPYQSSHSDWNNTNIDSALKDTPVNQAAINEEWQKYHSAWQDYYKNYYSDYYAKAAQTYLETEKLKNERTATGSRRKVRNIKHLLPIAILGIVILTGLFLQYNRQIFAPIMAYISPDTGSVTDNIEAVDANIGISVSPEPRLIIPKLNIDVPVAFGISNSEIDAAMNQGVAQFSIPGANALPGQIGNLAISGHSAGDIYSSNPYKFIFSGLERLENGDLIYINYESVRYTYQMIGREVVEPTDVGALIYGTDKPILTLITCTPLGTSRYRLLITAEQISPAYNTDNVALPTIADEANDDEAMPSNPPSFFENLWNGLFGN